MIDPKYQGYVFSFFMSLLMSGIMSLVITIFNLGLIPNLITAWLKAYAFSFAIALPTILTVTPTVRKLVQLTIKSPENG